MFVRKKKGKKLTSIQIVENKRINGKSRQKVLKHVGSRKNEDKAGIDSLFKAAIYVKYELEKQGQISLIPLEESDVNIQSIKKDKKYQYNINIYDLKEEGRIIRGISDIYGTVYQQLGFESLFGLKQKTKNYAHILEQIVLARVAAPKSKRASIEMLDKDYGISINLQAVYDMMGKIDEDKIDEIQNITFNYTNAILQEKINILFIDGTTLYFESQDEDGFREKGYSKDGKFHETQIALSLLVTESGLPVGYKVYPGKHYEANSLKDLIEETEKKYKINKVILVADSGFLNTDNIDYLEKRGNKYILGARIKNTSKALQKQITDKSKYIITKSDQDGNMIHGYTELDYKGKRMIVTYSAKRARKDAKDREKNIKKLLEKEGKNVDQLISNFGYKKFLKQVGKAKVVIDNDKIENAKKRDGLHGVITNDKDLTWEEINKHYKGLRQVEESFRINKHDLLIRPIFHRTEQKIKAHIAIAFMAFSLVRHLEYRLDMHGYEYSPEIIRRELLRVQGSIIYEEKNPNKKRFLPSDISNIGRSIYKTMGKKRTTSIQDII